MFYFKKLMATALSLCFWQTLLAQKHNIWFRTTLSYPINEKIKIDIELQHRRQNGFENDNLLDRNLMFTFRNWVHYQYSKDVKLSVSPFAYFTHYRIIQNPSDLTARPFHELRFSAAIDMQQQIFNGFYVINRTAAEYRSFQNTKQTDLIRITHRFGFRHLLGKKLKYTAFDEFFVNVAGTEGIHFFDHNRLGCSLEYSLLSDLKMEVGYIKIVRLPLTGNTPLQENNFFLNLTFQLHKRNLCR